MASKKRQSENDDSEDDSEEEDDSLTSAYAEMFEMWRPIKAKRFMDVPRYLYPHPKANKQGMMLYWDEDGVCNMTCYETDEMIYKNKALIENDRTHPLSGYTSEYFPRKAYNLSPFFDLNDDMDLYAFFLDVPGYQKECLCTFLPEPTSYYANTKVDFVGTFQHIPQRENHLVENKKVQNGRVFFSLPKGHNYKTLNNDVQYVSSEHVADYLEEATFWIFLWNAKTNYSYTMKMLSVEETEDRLMEGRPTARGFVHYGGENKKVRFEKYNLDFLDEQTNTKI